MILMSSLGCVYLGKDIGTGADVAVHQHSHKFLVTFSGCHKATRQKSRKVDKVFFNKG
jgi:hypothetical protein